MIRTLASKRNQGVKLPAFKIEDIWGKLIKSLMARGYQPDLEQYGTFDNFVQAVCCYFDMLLSKCCLYTDITEIITTLHKNGVRQGLLANTQFYTPLHLQLAFEEKLGKKQCQFDRYFEQEVLFFSHETGLMKPGVIFEQTVETLKTQGIKPHEYLYSRYMNGR